MKNHKHQLLKKDSDQWSY